MRVVGAILDVDGTLVDSNELHARAWVQALGEFGVDVPISRVQPLIGMASDKMLPLLTGLSAEGDEGAAIARRRGDIFRSQYLSTVQAFPGASELLQALRNRGLALVVASSAEKEDLRPLLALVDAPWLLDDAVSARGAERSKPDPDVICSALEKLGMPPGRVCMLGDTPYDVEAATRARVATIAFRCGGWTDADLHGAAALYDGPADLLMNLETSPLKAP
jgi:HAD superfamily hydrolase (TIGR01509 family)